MRSEAKEMKAMTWLTCLLLSLITVLDSCTVQSNPGPARHDTTQSLRAGAPRRPPACRELEGSWRSYEFRPGADVEMCGGAPCYNLGYAGPINFECQSEGIAGSKILSYASFPSPGRAHTTPLDIKVEGDQLLISHKDNQCLITYAVSLRDDQLAGEYTMENCAGPRWRGDRGKFLAVRFSQPAGGSTPAP
jgi:hypothetical protein